MNDRGLTDLGPSDGGAWRLNLAVNQARLRTACSIHARRTGVEDGRRTSGDPVTHAYSTPSLPDHWLNRRATDSYSVSEWGQHPHGPPSRVGQQVTTSACQAEGVGPSPTHGATPLAVDSEPVTTNDRGPVRFGGGALPPSYPNGRGRTLRPCDVGVRISPTARRLSSWHWSRPP